MSARTTYDDTETIRALMVMDLNHKPGSREALEQKHGQVYTPDEMAAEFRVLGFMAPFIVVERKRDGVKGSLMFQHDPRFYFGWQEDR